MPSLESILNIENLKIPSIETFLTPELFQQILGLGLKAIACLILVILTFVLARWVERSTSRVLEKSKVDKTLTRFFSSLARWSVVVLAGIVILGMFGVQTASIAAVLASASFAVGLALQGSLSNFASGLMLLIFRPFAVGDFVRTAGESGTVFQIDFLTTSLDTADNKRIVVPNSKIFGSTIENTSFHPYRRIDIDVGTSYDADIDQTRSVLEKVIADLAEPIEGRTNVVYLKNLGGSSIDWQVRVWSPTSSFWPLREKLVRQIKYDLDAAAIGIPYPQMDVHISKS